MDINLKGNRILNLPSKKRTLKKPGQLALGSNSKLKDSETTVGRGANLPQHMFFPGKTCQDHVATVAPSMWDVVPGIWSTCGFIPEQVWTTTLRASGSQASAGSEVSGSANSHSPREQRGQESSPLVPVLAMAFKKTSCGGLVSERGGNTCARKQRQWRTRLWLTASNLSSRSICTSRQVRRVNVSLLRHVASLLRRVTSLVLTGGPASGCGTVALRGECFCRLHLFGCTHGKRMPRLADCVTHVLFQSKRGHVLIWNRRVAPPLRHLSFHCSSCQRGKSSVPNFHACLSFLIHFRHQLHYLLTEEYQQTESHHKVFH